MLLAVKEMVRVLKPGGKVAAAVWNVPEKNFWITAATGVINKNIERATLPAGSPGMFRCAKDDFIAGLFSQAGLKNISQKEITGKLDCKTVGVYWDFMTEVVAPVVGALSKANFVKKEKIKTEVYQAVNLKYPAGNVFIDSSALVICGEK